MSYGSTAAKVRAEKECNPERFCAVRTCLWRIVTPSGPNPCRKHPVSVPRSFSIDGEGEFTLPELVKANDGDRELLRFLDVMRAGESKVYGGGAAAEFTITRTR